MILDLGCGNAKEEDADYGIDIVELDGVDLVWDLNNTPYPLESGSVEKIYMNDVIEHLDNPAEVIQECYRLLKSKGLLQIKVVYWNHRYSYSDPQHKWAFTELWFNNFLSSHGRNYVYDCHFNSISISYIYDNEAVKKWGDDPKTLQRKAYFHCNVIQGIIVTLEKE